MKCKADCNWGRRCFIFGGDLRRSKKKDKGGKWKLHFLFSPPPPPRAVWLLSQFTSLYVSSEPNVTGPGQVHIWWAVFLVSHALSPQMGGGGGKQRGCQGQHKGPAPWTLDTITSNEWTCMYPSWESTTTSTVSTVKEEETDKKNGLSTVEETGGCFGLWWGSKMPLAGL